MTGADVARLREAYDMTQEELARVLGAATCTVHRWEREGRAPRDKSQRWLLNFLHERRRAPSAQRQRLRRALAFARELGVHIPTVLNSATPGAMPGKTRELANFFRELAEL
jgi:transcriptional regulator with XRE-family HTH domain